MLKVLCALAAAGLFAFPALAATSDDSLIEGAKQCTRHLPHYEREYGIPTHLLSAIASTESGRYHEGLGLKVPWPWTINVEGKGYFFESKQAAIEAVNKYHARGIQSIDVGCMQVNLYHHPQAFSSLDQAFDPEANIAYAAGFLRDLYDENRSWRQAAADYHSRTPGLGAQYVSQVYDSWYGILQKLREAKMAVPDMSQFAANDAPAPYVGHVNGLMQERPVSHGLPEQQGKHLAQLKTPHMRVIELSGKMADTDHGVAIVRTTNHASMTPAVNVTAPAQQMTVAQARPASLDMNQAPEAKVVHVTPSDSNNRKTGPTFIFND